MVTRRIVVAIMKKKKKKEKRWSKKKKRRNDNARKNRGWTGGKGKYPIIWKLSLVHHDSRHDENR